ncbi:MAG TPA: glycosyltransferase [Rhizomicrobium sp.]|nr:glycosyltransferase [Rhizomicrobium sp.]
MTSFAIVITCYNYGHYVGQAIDSALSQIRAADEIIVLDDGSTDNSRSVISGYGGRIRPIFQTNQGYKEAINRGFRETEADVVLFLDADDALHPTALEKVERAWCPGLAKVQFDLDIIDGEGRRLGRRFANFTRDIACRDAAAAFRTAGTYRWPVTSGNAHARQFLEQVMPLTPPVGHDGVLNTIAPLYGGVYTIGEALGVYRLHGRNMSMTDARGGFKRHPDFARQISFRRREFDMLREQARAKGFALPRGDLLNNELVFVNYRLMAHKIAQSYEGQENDSIAHLWRRGMRLAAGESSWRAVLANSAWLSLLALAPRRAAAAMVVLRFNRAEFFRLAKEKADLALALFGRRPRSGEHHAPAVKGAGLSGRD